MAPGGQDCDFRPVSQTPVISPWDTPGTVLGTGKAEVKAQPQVLVDPRKGSSHP